MQPEGTPLLRTKLDVPPPHAHTLARERLLVSIANAPGARLVLVSAPAGFGKTTLLTTWCRTRLLPAGTAVAWVSLDEGDNDPGRFLAYLVASIAQAVGPDILREVAPAASDPVRGGGEATLTQLVNALAAADRDVVLILDDYHLISALAVHAAVAFLLEHLPQRACVAIGSRADPPLPVARLRAREQLVELRAADLRFTSDEAQAFLAANNTMLSANEAQMVGTYAEGWPAGIQLVALALRASTAGWPTDGGREPPDAPARCVLDYLDGSQQHVFAYLAEDVFERQPAHRKAFLLKTAILDRMCGPLCDAVLGLEARDWRLEDCDSSLQPPASSLDSYSRLILEELDHANLFVLPLDAERRWYRYHHLFRAFLRARLGCESSPTVADLHRRASAWYEQNNQLAQAAEHALAAGEQHRAAELRASLARAEYNHSNPTDHRVETLEGWAQANQPALVEPLSEREVEVLQLIASGASNHVIATRLVISIGTVKSHINHILGKLGAGNRTEAVSRARALGVLVL